MPLCPCYTLPVFWPPAHGHRTTPVIARRRSPMRIVDVVAHILKKEGIEYLSAFPTTPVIEAAASVGIRPIICRQERVGVGIADGYSRVKNGRPAGVFAMQYGPGAENAFAGVATSYSDSVPLLILPLGHPRQRDGQCGLHGIHTGGGHGRARGVPERGGRRVVAARPAPPAFSRTARRPRTGRACWCGRG